MLDYAVMNQALYDGDAEDQAAIDAHMATAHMAQYREDTDPMIAERIRTACAVVND